MKVVSIVGTRPNFIKLLPLAPKLEEKFDHIVIHTGQHYDYEMTQIFFESLPLPEVDYHLNLDKNWSEIQKISEIMIQLEKILSQIKPNLVLVYGDVNSTLAASLTASKLQLPIGHIEAGVRLHEKLQPEELIRIIVDNCSDLLFCPTESALSNLKEEKISGKCFFVGDVMLDAFLNNARLIHKSSILNQLNLKAKEYILVTIHRAENTDNELKLEMLIDALVDFNEISVFPCHPRTEKMLKQYNLFKKIKKSKNLILLRPVNYLNFLSLLLNAKKILTDSGGVQREAYFAKVPVIILYATPLWPEITKYGGGILANNKKMILDALQNFKGVAKRAGYGFGDGHAAEKIVQIIEENLPLKNLIN